MKLNENNLTTRDNSGHRLIQAFPLSWKKPRASLALACNYQKGKSVAEHFSDSSPVFPLDASVIKVTGKVLLLLTLPAPALLV